MSVLVLFNIPKKETLDACFVLRTLIEKIILIGNTATMNHNISCIFSEEKGKQFCITTYISCHARFF